MLGLLLSSLNPELCAVHLQATWGSWLVELRMNFHKSNLPSATSLTDIDGTLHYLCMGSSDKKDMVANSVCKDLWLTIKAIQK